MVSCCAVVALKGMNVHVNRFILYCTGTIDINILNHVALDNSTNFIVYT